MVYKIDLGRDFNGKYLGVAFVGGNGTTTDDVKAYKFRRKGFQVESGREDHAPAESEEPDDDLTAAPAEAAEALESEVGQTKKPTGKSTRSKKEEL